MELLSPAAPEREMEITFLSVVAMQAEQVLGAAAVALAAEAAVFHEDELKLLLPETRTLRQRRRGEAYVFPQMRGP